MSCDHEGVQSPELEGWFSSLEAPLESGLQWELLWKLELINKSDSKCGKPVEREKPLFTIGGDTN